MSGMSLCPAFRHRLRSLWHQFFGTIASMEFVLKNPCQQRCSPSSACPMVQSRAWKLWQVLGAQFFGTIVLMKFVLKNPCQQLRICSVAPCQRSYACPIAQCLMCLHTAWQVLGAQFFGTIALLEFGLKTRANSPRFSLSCAFTMSTLPSRCFPMELSPGYFPRFPVQPCPRFRLAPSQRSFATVSHP